MHRPLCKAVCAAAALLCFSLAPQAIAGEGARKVVSLNPSLTAILIAIGAQDKLVGVDDFSARQQTAVASLPRVGGLFNPSLEAVVALEPDLVVLVPSAEQRDFRERLETLGIPLAEFPNIRFAEVLENIERLGKLVGHVSQAEARIEAIERSRRAVEAVASQLPRARTLVILQRSPIFVVGRGSFIDEMLKSAGAENVGAEFDEPYPRVGAEWLLATGPDVLLDMSPDPEDATEFWSRWPALPAVKDGRIRRLDPERVTLPGPYLDRSLELLAEALHGESVRSKIAAAREAETTAP